MKSSKKTTVVGSKFKKVKAKYKSERQIRNPTPSKVRNYVTREVDVIIANPLKRDLE